MSLRFVFSCAIVSLMGGLLCGCCCSPVVRKDKTRRNDDADANIVCTNYRAVDRLLRKLKTNVNRNDRILAATLVDLNDLRRASMFGRVMGETLATRLTDHGYSVVNVKLRENSMLVTDQGEFLLSREMRNLAAAHNAREALVGTYARAGNSVFVNVRLVRTLDNVVVGAVDYELPNGPETRALFGEGGIPLYGTAMR